MLDFIGDHIGTIVQFLLTAWLAKVARDFQVTFSIYGTRLDTTREAVRRARLLYFLKRTAPDAPTTEPDSTATTNDTMNEMMDWIAVNEVYLTPAAASAFMDVHLWKLLQGTMPGGTNLHEQFQKADEGLKRLSVELLRFRKRPLGELVWEWGAKIFGKKAAAPNAGTVAPGEIGRSSAGSE